MKKLLLFFLALKGFSMCNDVYSPEFTEILNQAVLQAPTSKHSYKITKGFCNRYFYLKNGCLVFDVSENKNAHRRSELRFLKQWHVQGGEKSLEIEIKIEKTNRREFTFLQILNKSEKPQPLLRVLWYDRLKNRKDHIWAFVRLNDLDDEKSEIKIFDLGKMEKSFFTVKAVVKDAKLSVYVNGDKKIDSFDVSYWQKPSYFKTGVYLQDTGEAKVCIKKIKLR